MGNTGDPPSGEGSYQGKFIALYLSLVRHLSLVHRDRFLTRNDQRSNDHHR